MEVSNDLDDALDLIRRNSVVKISNEKSPSRMDEEIGAYYVDSIEIENISDGDRYFDYKAYGRDIRLEYYPMDNEDPETAGEYWCGDELASDEEIGHAVVGDLGWDGVGKEIQKRYFDYEAFGRDIQMDSEFVQTEDGIFEIQRD